MSVWRRAWRVLTGVALLASAGYAFTQLRRLAAVKKSLSAPGASAEGALAGLAAQDESGVVRGLITAQAEQMKRLGAALPGEDGASSTPPTPEPDQPPAVADGAQRLFTAARPGPGAGTGVLIDHKTGERHVVQAVRRAPAPGPGAVPAAARGSLVPRLPAPPATLRRLFSDDLRARRSRAYALLLGTVAVAVVLVVRARRALMR